MRFAGFIRSFFVGCGGIVVVAISVSTFGLLCHASFMCAHCTLQCTSVHMKRVSSILWIIIASAKLNFIFSFPLHPYVRQRFRYRRRHQKIFQRQCVSQHRVCDAAISRNRIVLPGCQCVKRAGF